MIVGWLVVAFAAITVEGAPLVGEPVVVAITDEEGRPRGGETVRATHRRGLTGEREVALGITDALGRVRWEPEEAGVVHLRAGADEHALRVAWVAPPAEIAVELALLGLASVGAFTWGLFGHRARRPRP